MQLTERVGPRLDRAGQRFEQLKRPFQAFIERLACFAAPRCEVRGVVVTPTPDEFYFTVSFTTVTVGFRFLLALEANSVAHGRVVCTLEKPTFTETKPVLGSFTFNGQGETDFEVAEGVDKLDIDFFAPEIVLHFINAALERPAPEPTP